MRITTRILMVLVCLLMASCQASGTRMAQVPVFYRSQYVTAWDVAYGPHERHRMDIHMRGSWATPEGGFNIRLQGDQPPTVVFLHGSAWYLSDKQEWAHVISPLMQNGYNVVNINYRLRAGIRASVTDVHAALCHLDQNNDRYGLDLDRVILSGVSAGGHMSTLIAVSQNEPETEWRLPESIKVRGVVSVVGGGNGCVELYHLLQSHEHPFWNDVADTLVEDHDRAAEIMTELCPSTYFSSGDPPMLMGYGLQDEFGSREKYMELVAMLDSHGIAYELIGYPNSGHNLLQDDWVDFYIRAYAFIDRHAAPAP